MIRILTTMIVSMVIFLPCLLVVSEIDTVLPNLCGFIYIAILCIIGRTKVGKIAIYKVIRANKELEYLMTKNK